MYFKGNLIRFIHLHSIHHSVTFKSYLMFKKPLEPHNAHFWGKGNVGKIKQNQMLTEPSRIKQNLSEESYATLFFTSQTPNKSVLTQEALVFL